MEILIVITIIVVFVILNSLPFIAGVLQTPAGSIFLGTVHWPGDYFSYLSQFAQGKESWFTSYDLYTNDFPQKTLVGWVNVFLGHLFNLIGIDHLAAYQLSVVIFTVLFLLTSYILIREIYTENAMGRILAFILFVISNAFPGYDYWFNNGIPFNRLGGVPHHLIARTVIVLSLFLALRWWRKTNIKDQISKIKYIFGFFLMGFVLASVEPVHWILTVVVLILIPLLDNIKNQRSNIKNTNQKLKILIKQFLQLTTYNSQLFIPSLFLLLGGLPMAIYLKRLLTNPPYSQLSSWEVSQQLSISPLDFVLANGPVMVLAIVGLVLLLYYQTGPAARVTRCLVFVFPLLTIGLFFSPLPRLVSIVNVRFLPAVTTLFLAILATEAISLARSHLARLAVATAVMLVVLPTYYVQIQNRIKVDPVNAFFYLPQKTYETYRQAQRISNLNDTFLVIWPFNWSFPAITGRRVYEGHSLATIDYQRKELLTRSFFFGDMSITDMEKMLKIERISYVVTYPWTRNIDQLTNLEEIFDNGSLGIYKVK